MPSAVRARLCQCLQPGIFSARLNSTFPPTGQFCPFTHFWGPPVSSSSPDGGYPDIPLRVGLPPLRILIVDDEPVARRVLQEEVELLPDLELVGEAENGRAALDKITAVRPDLVLLDLQMPESGGFDVIGQLRSGTQFPAIIIVTAFDQYAIQALEQGAIDYLLKPVGHARFVQAIEKARKVIGNPSAAAESLARLQEVAGGTPPPLPPRKIVGRVGEEYFLLSASEVLAFQADGETVWIITAKQKFLATQSLRKFEERLVGSNFRRVHRKALINMEHVRKLSALSSNRWMITLNNNQQFVVSKRMARNVREVLSW